MSTSKRTRLMLATFGFFCTLSLVVVSSSRFGMPLTLFTWVVVVLCALSGAALGLRGKRPIVLFGAALLVCTYLVIPRPFQVTRAVEEWSLFDDVGGRSGRAITPGLQFGADGPNTALLESYVGPLRPHWWYQSPLSPGIRDGNERVQSRNIIRYAYFPEILRMLPDDDARRTVIQCLTDPENRLRVHQGLLLPCLLDLKYPTGMDRDSWWSHHRFLFHSEYDPVVAASLTQGWLDNVDRIYAGREMPSPINSQYRAVRYQQQGSWGGHYDFGEAFTNIELGTLSPDAASRESADRIIWWPER